MKRTIKSAVVSLSMFALMALSAMPAAAHSPETSSLAAQPTGYSIVTTDTEYFKGLSKPVPTNGFVRGLSPVESSSTAWNRILNGFKRRG